jgi:integrase
MNKMPKTPKLTVQVGLYTFASPEMLNRPMGGNGKRWSVGVILQHNIDVVLAHHNSTHSKRRKSVSYKTMQNRTYEIKQAGWLLVKKGINEDCILTGRAMRIMLPTNLTKRHIIKLTRTWEANPALSPATVVEKKSILSVFMRWLGKDRLMKQIQPHEFFVTPELIKRVAVSNMDKSWLDADVDAMIRGVEKENKYLARQLRLSQNFGLRVKESMLFRPHQDIDFELAIIHVRHGVKSGHKRTIQITTPEQVEVLKDAIVNCSGAKQSMMPIFAKLTAWRSHYYYILNKHGIKRSNGIVPHGLRHQFSQNLYLQKTGELPKSVTGQKPAVDSFRDQVARLFISDQLGHSRMSISSTYIGDNKSTDEGKKND